ncbi:hypothetical protein [Actinomadura sp. WMMA1423]|uniref:hypothetical protein n=1 Tax=Actinomadura sp. WMMA1423 TaxID=2591108 RepID=UPI0011463412|nr:hypothetical protein [Actinomadura sp. WMMA1423]
MSKAPKGLGLFVASLAVVVAATAGCGTGSSSEGSDVGRPSAPHTVYIQPSPSVTGVGETASAAPATGRPEATASESSDTSDPEGIVVAKFADRDKGLYLVLAPAGADMPSLKYLAKYDLRDLSKVPSYLPYSGDLKKVDVSSDAFASCAQYDTYPSCADTASSTTER